MSGPGLPPEAVDLVSRVFDWLMDRDFVDWVGREVELERRLISGWRPGMTGRDLVDALRCVPGGESHQGLLPLF